MTTNPKAGRGMDPVFAAGLRTALVEHVTAVAVPHRPRRRRWMLAGGALLSLGLAGGGVAVAQQWWGLPGADVDTVLAPSETAVHIGPATLDLSDAPAGANTIDLAVTCLSPGTLTFPDGASITCTDGDVAPGQDGSYSLPLTAGQTTLTIDAGPGVQWSLVTTYLIRAATDWAVNARGQTYGVVNDRGTPDLIAADATNGRSGYVSSDELDAAGGGNPTSPEQALQEQADRAGTTITIPVYEADGMTVIGDFVIG